MKRKCFNVIKFKKAISYFKSDPYRSKQLLEEYRAEYPLDFYGKLYYIYCMIILNEIDNAILLLKEVENDLNYKSYQYLQDDKLEKIQEDILINKIRILSALGQYEKIYDLLLNNQFVNANFDSLKLLCECKLGLVNKNSLDRPVCSYSRRQIIDYSEDDFKEHIKKHLADYNADVKKPNSSVFSSDFDLDLVLSNIKKYIPSDKRMLINTVSDLYVFKLDDCGRDNGIITDYFVVTCYHDTSNIITMCPARDKENAPHVNLNYLLKPQKVKSLSQIEKFNRRFNRK